MSRSVVAAVTLSVVLFLAATDPALAVTGCLEPETRMKELLPSYTLIGIASVKQLTCEIVPEPIEVLPRGITSHAIKTSAVTLRFREVWRGRADG